MAEFASISNLLSEKCEENSNLHKYCQTIAAKYLYFAKEEIRAQNAREENLMLKIDIGNLESINRTVTENNEALAELDSLLIEYYDEHLKFAFDIDEFELEKIANYDEIKLELETRDSINMYQRLYEHKLKIAQKMDQRNIVKKYRKAEQEYLKTKTERFDIEESVNKLKTKAEEFNARRLEEIKLIHQLVQGSADLEALFADLHPQSQSQFSLPGSLRSNGITLPDLKNQKLGLSSRMLVNFSQFKIPSIPKIRQINQRNGLNRLLQQAEVIRKSMQTSPIVLSGDFATPKLTGILKIPNDYTKPSEASQKTVSFDVDLHTVVPSCIETQEVTPEIPSDNLYPSETVDDTEMEESFIEKEFKKPKIEIIDDVLIKPADKIFVDKIAQPKVNSKRKANNEDSEYTNHSSPKIKCSPSEMSINNGSKSFMDMFLDFSKETPVVTSSDFEPFKNLKQTVKQPTPEIEKVKEIKEKKPIEKMTNEVIQKQETKIKTKASTKQFDGFENFLFQFAGGIGGSKENDESVADDISFDFSPGKEDAEHNNDDGCDNLSFEF